MKVSKEQREKAAKIGKEHKTNIVFVNNKNEFFTSENLASLSVQGNKEKYAKIDVSALPAAEETAEEPKK